MRKRNATVAVAILICLAILNVLAGSFDTALGWVVYLAVAGTLAWGVWRHSDA